MAAVEPNALGMARADRAFRGRAVRFLASQDIRQYLGIGSGIPTRGNVHEVAQAADPGAEQVDALPAGDLRVEAEVTGHLTQHDQLVRVISPPGMRGTTE